MRESVCHSGAHAEKCAGAVKNLLAESGSIIYNVCVMSVCMGAMAEQSRAAGKGRGTTPSLGHQLGAAWRPVEHRIFVGCFLLLMKERAANPRIFY